MKYNFELNSSNRVIDELTGKMRVSNCHITKADVNDYMGFEIPYYQELGLDPNKIYAVYRPFEELEKAIDGFKGAQLFLGHHPTTATELNRDDWVGSIGTDVIANEPYLDASITVNDQAAIEAINSEAMKELSSAYTYKPVIENGSFNGKPYQIRMTELKPNHVAIVEVGRAGHEVCVADEQTINNRRGYFMADALDKVKNLLDSAKEALTGGTEEGERQFRQREDVAENELGIDESETKTAKKLSDPRVLNALVGDDRAAELGQELYAISDTIQDREQGDRIKAIVNELRLLERNNERSDRDDVLEELEGAEDNLVTEVINDEEVITTCVGDSKMKKGKLAMDAASIAAQAEHKLMASIQSKQKAAAEMRCLVGDVDIFAVNSANDIYKMALQAQGVDISSYTPDQIAGAAKFASQHASKNLSMDWMNFQQEIDSEAYNGAFKHLNKVKIG